MSAGNGSYRRRTTIEPISCFPDKVYNVGYNRSQFTFLPLVAGCFIVRFAVYSNRLSRPQMTNAKGGRRVFRSIRPLLLMMLIQWRGRFGNRREAA